ncbi:pilus assembly protein TadG-related protein [Sneathiella chinensis]|uniref:Putative Flp pilus-assembly TadG-like N-terminal domain-containing protein n=1 Tax=Sneathiella chinensis TaxID=349750 RepID=A0ABQ5TYX8_9PROT|nr:TadE/TadG family type IV pilus assembly protein [Sneathiella chinensis]GLQ05062.1 hypothetical protein GCM10007924_02830 [Sneathiella chinensis]
MWTDRNGKGTIRNHLWRRFCRDESGAIVVYVGLIAIVLVGIGALTLDLGRLFVTGTETQSYVDAAALAGAYQLDGQDGARARATAVINDKLFTNRQTVGALDSNDAMHPITVDTITFYSSLDGNVVATGDRDARFVEVNAFSTSVENSLIGFVGGPANSRAVRAATAGNKQVLCDIPPLMMCNPQETASFKGFTIGKGQQYIAKYSGPGAGMAPGTFGLLDSPNCGQGSKCIAELLAHASPASGCYANTVDLRPGQANGIRQALNTRFDIYEQPYFGSKKNDSNYHAALNVTKGYVKDGPGNSKCGNIRPYDPAVDPTPAMKMPRDNCLMDGTCERVGDGTWNRDLYWSVNHPGQSKPADYASMSRYDIYRYELDNSMVPDNGPSGEKGAPTCNVPAADPSDRRTFIMAVVNCLEQEVNGNEEDVEVLTYMEVFLTEPVSLPSDSGTCTNSNPNADPDDDPIYTECATELNKKMEFVVEMIREVSPGDQDGVLHDMVQLYR